MDVLKVASWNVENLFDTVKNGSEYEEYIPGRHNWTESIFKKKLSNISQVICDLDADVIGLQEIENDNALRRLQRFLARVGCPYPYRAITSSKNTPIHNALLSRVPIAQKRDIRVTFSGKYRSILEVTLKTDPPFKIFVNHWRSKAAPESERVVYAKVLAGRIDVLPGGYEYVVLGDFNSDYDEYRTIEKKHNDTGSFTGINQVLGTSLGSGPLVGRKDLANSCKKRICHYNLWLEIESHKRWSHNFFGDKEAKDAILIPPSMLDEKGWEYKIGSFGVFAPGYIFGRHGEIRRWEYRHGRHSGKGFSDHLPVYALFEKKDTGLLDIFFAGDKSAKNRKAPEKTAKGTKGIDIGDLLKKERLEHPLVLKGAVLLFKRKRNGVVIQPEKGTEAVLLYGCAGGMKEGHRYDLDIRKIKRYKGMPEVTDLGIVKEGERVDVSPYIISFDPEKMFADNYGISQIVKDIKGIYRGGKIHTGGKSFKIYFKKRRWTPPEGSSITVYRAQIGYYKNQKEIVVWSDRDFEIGE